jgi:hypothetical protein
MTTLGNKHGDTKLPAATRELRISGQLATLP